MIKFKIEGEPYIIDDFMSIENYVKIYKIKDLFSEDYFASKLISIISGAPQKDLMEGGYEEINYLALRIMESLPTTETTKFSARAGCVKRGEVGSTEDSRISQYAFSKAVSSSKIGLVPESENEYTVAISECRHAKGMRLKLSKNNSKETAPL